MSVDKDTVLRIAKLARIALDDGQAAAMEQELNALLAWVEQLQEVDVKGVEPLTSIVAMKMKQRKDEVIDGHYAQDVTRNAPATEDEFFIVPKVVE